MLILRISCFSYVSCVDFTAVDAIFWWNSASSPDPKLFMDYRNCSEFVHRKKINTKEDYLKEKYHKTAFKYLKTAIKNNNTFYNIALKELLLVDFYEDIKKIKIKKKKNERKEEFY